jgi:hypothetical protein
LCGAAGGVHLCLTGALPWSAPPHAETGHVETNTRVASDRTVAGVEGGDGFALVDWLDTLIWEFAETTVGTVKVTNLTGHAGSCKESVDEGIACSTWHWCAQATLGPLNAFLVVDVAGTPLVGDWVAFCQALVHIKAVWDLSHSHDDTVVLVFACTFKSDNFIIQGHLLTFRIALLFPIGPAGPHATVSAVASAWVVCNWAFAWECWDGEAIWPVILIQRKIRQWVITPARLVLLDVCTAGSSQGDGGNNGNGAHFWWSEQQKISTNDACY